MKETEELITREEACKRFPIPLSELRRSQRVGELKPVKKGEKNALFFRLKDIKDLYEKRVAKKGDYTKSEAANAFAEFEKGKTPIECVVALHLTPEAAEALYTSYATMKGALYIPGVVLKEIDRMEIDGPLPLKSPEDLVELLTGLATEAAQKSLKCTFCKKAGRVKAEDARYCKTCVAEYTKAMVEKATGTDEL